nr:AlNc14C200G8660 [Albugo laibachii Nc14]|eukprot:CCA23599.1 AlNc14C200G8660 [Albugo laibachii Nc14]
MTHRRPRSDGDSLGSCSDLDAVYMDTSSLNDDITSSGSSPCYLSACNALQSADVSEKLAGAASIAKLNVLWVVHDEPMCQSVCEALIQHGLWSDNEVVQTTCCSQFLLIVQQMESGFFDVFLLLVDSMGRAVQDEAFYLSEWDLVSEESPKYTKALALISTIRILEGVLDKLPEEWNHWSPKAHARAYLCTFSLLGLSGAHTTSPILLTIMACLHANEDARTHWLENWLLRSPYREQLGCAVRESGFWKVLLALIETLEPLKLLEPPPCPLETIARNVIVEIVHLLAICAEYEKSCGILQSSPRVLIDWEASGKLEFQTFDSENNRIFHLTADPAVRRASVNFSRKHCAVEKQDLDPPWTFEDALALVHGSPWKQRLHRCLSCYLFGVEEPQSAWAFVCQWSRHRLEKPSDVHPQVLLWLPFSPNEPQSSTLSIMKHLSDVPTESEQMAYLSAHQHLICAWYLISTKDESPANGLDVLSSFAKAWRQSPNTAARIVELPPIHSWNPAFLVRNASALIQSGFCDCLEDALKWFSSQSVDDAEPRKEFMRKWIHLCRSSTALASFLMEMSSDTLHAVARELVSMRKQPDALYHWLQEDGCLPLLSFQPLLNALWSLKVFSKCFSQVDKILSSLWQHLETSVMVQSEWEECPASLYMQRDAFEALLCVLSGPLISHLKEEETPTSQLPLKAFVWDAIQAHFVQRACASFNTVGQDICVLRFRLLLSITDSVFGCHRIASLLNGAKLTSKLGPISEAEGHSSCHSLADRFCRQLRATTAHCGSTEANENVLSHPSHQAFLTYLELAGADSSLEMDRVCEYTWALVTHMERVCGLTDSDLNRILSSAMIAIAKCVKRQQTSERAEDSDANDVLPSIYRRGEQILETFLSRVDLESSMKGWSLVCHRNKRLRPDCFTLAVVIMIDPELECDIVRVSKCLQLECTSPAGAYGPFMMSMAISKAVEWILAFEAPEVFQSIASCNGSILSLIARWRDELFWGSLSWPNIAIMTMILVVYGPEFQV